MENQKKNYACAEKTRPGSKRWYLTRGDERHFDGRGGETGTERYGQSGQRGVLREEKETSIEKRTSNFLRKKGEFSEKRKKGKRHDKVGRMSEIMHLNWMRGD